MDTEKVYGTCKHCKQIRIIPESELEKIRETLIDGQEIQQDALDILATLNCDCEDAKREQHIVEIVLSTKENINMLFQDEFPAEAELLCEIVEFMVTGKISKVSLQLRHNTKATMTRNNVGEIKIQKVVTDKNELLS